MIVLLATVVVVCGGIVVVAVGRGGQIAEFSQDAPPLELPARRPIAGTDVALLRLPTGPWGYSYRATDDALRRIAHAITERDTRIAVLEQQVAELRAALRDRTDGEPGSPWFDRSASFEGRRRPVASRTGEAAAIGAAPVDTPEDPAGAGPGDAGRADHASADVEPGHGAPEDTKPAAGHARAEQKAWTPGAAWFENGAAPKPAEPVDEPGAGAAEADEDWAFEDDEEPAAEPAEEPAAEPGGKPAASALGFSAPVPWPGDRLVATSRPRTETGDTAGEKAGEKARTVGADGADGADTVEDETGTSEVTAEGKADEVEDDAADTPADEPGGAADGGSRGEGH